MCMCISQPHQNVPRRPERRSFFPPRKSPRQGLIPEKWNIQHTLVFPYSTLLFHMPQELEANEIKSGSQSEGWVLGRMGEENMGVQTHRDEWVSFLSFQSKGMVTSGENRIRIWKGRWGLAAGDANKLEDLGNWRHGEWASASNGQTETNAWQEGIKYLRVQVFAGTLYIQSALSAEAGADNYRDVAERAVSLSLKSCETCPLLHSWALISYAISLSITFLYPHSICCDPLGVLVDYLRNAFWSIGESPLYREIFMLLNLCLFILCLQIFFQVSIQLISHGYPSSVVYFLACFIIQMSPFSSADHSGTISNILGTELSIGTSAWAWAWRARYEDWWWRGII